jgi:tetratricopeptide (TPR) repeat protein
MDRLRRHRVRTEAEGYLDLIMVFADRWPLSPAIRDRVANRVLQLAEQLIEGGHDLGEVLLLQGQALRAMERYDDAIDSLVQAADNDPDNLHTWLALGWCYKRVGRLDLAIEALEEALAVEPGEAILYYNLACYWSLANNVQLALDFLGQALELNPRFRELVDGESDFDPIRNEPGFQALVSVIV